jgi:pre-mRNA-splicing helicase BRR2
MADREDMQKLYSYNAMSNKVEKADRSGSARRNRGEGTGEVESLRGRTDAGRMGDRIIAATSSKPPVPPRKKARRTTDNKQGPIARSGETILDLGDLTGYQPSTDQARAAYEAILTIIGSRAFLGNQGLQVLRDAAEEVIRILKDPALRDPERLAAVRGLLLTAKDKSAFRSEQFATLFQLGKQLDDYDTAKTDAPDEGGLVDDEMGVAVVFDEDAYSDKDSNGDSDVDDDVVVDASSDESDKERESDEPNDIDGDDDDLVVQGIDKKKGRHGVDRVLSVHEIDAHFLQRQLSRYFDDADTTATLSEQVLDILNIQNGSDLRECENKLLVLLGFDLFETIKLVLHNRIRVWGCVSLKRAQTGEQRMLIEQALSDETSGEGKRIWEELHSKGRAEDWARERMKGAADTIKAGHTDVSKAIDSIGVKVEGGDGGTTMDVVTPDEARELDLEALILRDGAHTMSSKHCVLPDTSWRAMKKGYEEVHVPAIRSVIPKDEKLVFIKELPQWTQAAFKGKLTIGNIKCR